jgi:diaminopimelate epimerase
MTLPYTKMSGAGNTFIVIEESCLPEGTEPGPLAPSLCAEDHEHAGADGLIVVAPSELRDFEMLYFNRDGSTGMMCGNGGRCAVRFAADHGYVSDTSTVAFENAGVLYRARITERGVKVWFPDPRAVATNLDLEVLGAARRCHFADVGTPHAILFVDDIHGVEHVADVDVARWGPPVRRHRRFEPHGANANFVEVVDAHRILLRTFERGVEGETGACGTGAISAALVAAIERGLVPPIEVTTSSGDRLWVDFELDGENARNVSLEGSADVMLEGEIGLAW